MAMNHKRLSDQKVEIIISNILRAGVILSAVIVLIGGIFYLARYGFTVPDYRVFHGEPSDLRSIPGIFHDVIGLKSRGLIQLGLLFLIATPVSRVAFSVMAFFRQRDILYVVITLFVLTVLIISLAGVYV